MIVFRNMRIATLDDVDIKGRKVLLRVDINSPIDPVTGEIMDLTRIREHSITIKEILDSNASLVIISHQGRPLSKDFTTLEKHSEYISKITGYNVEYLEDVMGP